MWVQSFNIQLKQRAGKYPLFYRKRNGIESIQFRIESIQFGFSALLITILGGKTYFRTRNSKMYFITREGQRGSYLECHGHYLESL